MKKKIINPVPQSELQLIKWPQVRSRIEEVNPKLAKIIDTLNPSFNLTLGKYSYGAIIASGEDKKNLPNFLVLNKSCEVFWEYRSRPITARIIKAGEIALGNLNSEAWQHPLWKLSAGGKNVFIPAKISDYERHKKLQDYFGFEVNRPFQFYEQRHVFSLIANSNQVADPWQCEVLFFGEEWFQYQDDPAWQPFYKYLLQEALQHDSQLKAYHPIFDLVMSIFQQEKSKKLSINQIQGIAQLFMLALNNTPGFTPLQDDSMMPLKLIQSAYLECYKLKQYEPIVMGPGYFNETGQNREAIYFSMNHRNFYQFAPSENNFASHAKEFYQLYWAFEKFINFIKTKNYLHPEHKISQLIKNTEFMFYHPGSPTYQDFIPTEEIPFNNSAFAKSIEKGFQFPAKSSFFNGSIQIKNSS